MGVEGRWLCCLMTVSETRDTGRDEWERLSRTIWVDLRRGARRSTKTMSSSLGMPNKHIMSSFL